MSRMRAKAVDANGSWPWRCRASPLPCWYPPSIRSHRKESSIGIGIALVLLFLFYLFIILSDAMVDRPQYAPT